MITVRNRETKLIEDVVGNGSGGICVEPMGRYQDLGMVIDASNVPAGAYTYSPAYTSLEWVRHFVALSQTSQTFSLAICRRDSSGREDWGSQLLVDRSAHWGLWETYAGSPSCDCKSGIIGHGCRFRLENKGASAANMRLAVQVLGL